MNITVDERLIIQYYNLENLYIFHTEIKLITIVSNYFELHYNVSHIFGYIT